MEKFPPPLISLLMSLLPDFFSPHFLFRNAVVTSLLMGALCPILGRHLVYGRTILLGLALPEISITGIALLFLGSGLGWSWCHVFNHDFSRALVGSMILTLPTLVILALNFARQRTLTEGWLAFLYLAASSTTHLILSHHAVGETYIEDLIHGRMLLVGNRALGFFAATLVTTTLTSLLLRKRILMVLSDGDFARSLSLNISLWHILIALLNGAAIGTAVAIAGPMVTFGFLILPVLSAGLTAQSLHSHLVQSVGHGIFTGLTGFWISHQWDLPLGATMVATGVTFLLLVLSVTQVLNRK